MEQKWTIGNIVYVANVLILVCAGLFAGANAATAQGQPAVTQPQVASQSLQPVNNTSLDCDPFQKPYRSGSANLEDQMRDLELIIAEGKHRK